MINLEEYKDNEVFKSLQAVFSDEYIAEQIEAGNVRIEKSAKAGDNESETKQEEKIDKEEKAAVDAEKKVKEDEKDYKEDKDSEGKVEKLRRIQRQRSDLNTSLSLYSSKFIILRLCLYIQTKLFCFSAYHLHIIHKNGFIYIPIFDRTNKSVKIILGKLLLIDNG